MTHTNSRFGQEKLSATLALIRRQGSAGATSTWLASKLGISQGLLQQRILVLNNRDLAGQAIRSMSGRYVLVPAEFPNEYDLEDFHIADALDAPHTGATVAA